MHFVVSMSAMMCADRDVGPAVAYDDVVPTTTVMSSAICSHVAW